MNNTCPLCRSLNITITYDPRSEKIKPSGLCNGCGTKWTVGGRGSKRSGGRYHKTRTARAERRAAQR